MDQKKNDEILKILLQIAEHCEALSTEIRFAVSRIIEEKTKFEDWKVLNAPSPVDVNDRAVRWLAEKCLPEVARKHPDIKWELMKAEDGKVVGLRYFCKEREVEDDIVKPATWAFEVASSRGGSGK